MAAALCALPAAIRTAEAQTSARASPFSSAPVDRRLYREDAVRRISLRAGGWQADCDEIIPLKRRYCSLSTAMVDQRGGIAARLAVSTGDDGRPAMLLRLPHGLILSRPAQLSSTPARGKVSQRRLKPVSCDAQGCTLIWRPQNGELAALRSGGSLEVIYWRWRAGALARLPITLRCSPMRTAMSALSCAFPATDLRRRSTQLSVQNERCADHRADLRAALGR